MSRSGWIVLVIGICVVVAAALIFMPHIPTTIDYITEDVPKRIKWIMLDAKTYEILRMRWTVVDWVLGLFATGTAVTAAMKNAFTAHGKDA
jgi:hypothetical protein